MTITEPGVLRSDDLDGKMFWIPQDEFWDHFIKLPWGCSIFSASSCLWNKNKQTNTIFMIKYVTLRARIATATPLRLGSKQFWTIAPSSQNIVRFKTSCQILAMYGPFIVHMLCTVFIVFPFWSLFSFYQFYHRDYPVVIIIYSYQW